MEQAIILLVIGLTISGFVLKNAPLLIASSVSWIIFAFYMFHQTFTNTYLNTAFLVFGWMMFAICIFSTLTMFTRGRPTKVDQDLLEQENYRRQVLNATKRR